MQAQTNISTKISEVAASVLVTIAATALLVMMFLMATDVICRYLFNSPIPGALEMIEFLMAIIVPLSIAYCGFLGSHVAVDLFVERLPSKVRKVFETILTLISSAFVVVIAWQNFGNIADTYRSNLTSAVLKIPSYPFVACVAIGMTVFAAVLFVHLFVRKSKEISDGTN